MSVTKIYSCVDCQATITAEGPTVESVSFDAKSVLCQRCDPDYSSLRDNKYHECTSLGHQNKLHRGDYSEGPGGVLTCPACNKTIGKFRQ